MQPTKIWVPADEHDSQRYDPLAVFRAGLRNHHIANTAYPIAHEKTWRSYRVARDRIPIAVAESYGDLKELNLYAHIPFCEKRCYYCEYTVVGKLELDQTRDYMDLLGRELELYAKLLDTRHYKIRGFDIGGGTPTFVSADLISDLIDRVGRAFALPAGLEISIETTPRIASEEPQKIRDLYRAGIRRISMGVQVTQPDLLRMLNRDTNGIEFHRRAVDHIRAAGFENMNIDVMYGFAGQSLESLQATLEHVIALEPEAITLYRMRYKLTRISDQAHQVRRTSVLKQAALAKSLLLQAGFQANPGKNTFTKMPGSSGTSHYIENRVVRGLPYLGFGLGAQSLSNHSIAYNSGAAGKTIPPYRRAIMEKRLPIQDQYVLPLEHMMAKMIAVSFYFGEIHLPSFEEKFGVSLGDAFAAERAFVLENGLMQESGEFLSLTERGARLYNGVIALFYAPSVQKYLLDRRSDSGTDLKRNRRLALAVAGDAR
ncbi:MAG: radical SAM protein [Spirochaetales bacterium]|nr:radical SAM protein [Leptospiraceae bacterium]MCP5480734.1 radical SAM protein [Spirochaetales bacterium]MCP5484086.1 radical SAM protein [Spirochaetales bacterium]